MDKRGYAGQGLLTREDSIVVIIDAQEKLVPAVSQAQRLIENMKRLLSVAQIMALPVVATEQEKLGPTICEIAERIRDFEPISKLAFNCFLSEPFAERVRETGRKSLIIAGIEAHICVTQTALWAHPGFRVHVLSDGISSRSPDNISVAVERMRASGVTITSAEMVIYELLQRAGTEEFRAVLPLVK